MPSKTVLEQKQAIVNGLADELKNAKTLVFADYRGLTVEQDTELRAVMRKENVTYRVVKNRLTKLATEKVGMEGLKDFLTGPTVMAYSTEDVIAPAKLVKQFSTKYPVLEIKGGSMDGEVMDIAAINSLASIPDVPVLHGKLVTSLISPIAGLAIMLGALRDKGEEAGAEKVSELAVAKEAADEPAAEPAEEAAAAPEAEETTEEPAETPAE